MRRPLFDFHDTLGRNKNSKSLLIDTSKRLYYKSEYGLIPLQVKETLSIPLHRMTLLKGVKVIIQL